MSPRFFHSEANAALAQRVLRAVAFGLAMVVIGLPLAAERAVESAVITDSLGSFPVEVSLSHNGISTVETGILGDLYWDEAGSGGFGLEVRVTQPPPAGGTLASYVSPAFVEANLAFVDNPEEAISTYVAALMAQISTRVLGYCSALFGIGVAVSFVPLTRRWLVAAAVGSLAGSLAIATYSYQTWDGRDQPSRNLRFPDEPRLSFSSPQTLEVARQVRPFIEKNNRRLAAQTARYLEAAETSFEAAFAQPNDLEPRFGEVLVSAEADPQGSIVGTEARSRFYELLSDAIGERFALRTIAGDVTSNGTVAEGAFVDGEVAVSDRPVVVALGDHDAAVTGDQLSDAGASVLDLESKEIAGLSVYAATDTERKALFGALISNPSGVTTAELGLNLRAAVEGPATVVVHQPEAMEAYLGVSDFRSLSQSYTTPVEDDLVDAPAGSISAGHLHELEGPWVVWNTDTDRVTWTLVDLIGTTGGVENAPTFNRFSTPTSLPLKPLAWRLHFYDVDTGLATGFISVTCSTSGDCSLSPRTDVGLPLGEVGLEGQGSPQISPGPSPAEPAAAARVRTR